MAAASFVANNRCSRVEKGCTGCSVALRSKDEGKSLENLLPISRGEEKLGKARISDSRMRSLTILYRGTNRLGDLREQGGQVDGWYPLVAKHATSKGRSVSPSKRNLPQGSIHLRLTFEPDPLAADKAREKLRKHFPELSKEENLIESMFVPVEDSRFAYIVYKASSAHTRSRHSSTKAERSS